MARGTRHRPGSLTADQQRLYDKLAGGARGTMPGARPLAGDDGVLTGPFNAMLHSPAVGDALQALGVAVRSATGLDARVRELVILVVARHLGSAVEWTGHTRIARALGVTETVLTQLSQDTAQVRLPAEYAVAGSSALALARDLLNDVDLDDAAYGAAVAVLGEAGVFEVITTVGYYWTLAKQLSVFAVDETA